MKKQIIITVKYFFLITALTGIIYPLLITAVSGFAFPYNAAGSFIEKDGKIIGSEFIGQKFESDRYFWSRPSAIDYNPMPSGGSNSGPTSAALKKSFDERKKTFIEKNMISDASIVQNEMFFASCSGVDPHISPASALLQVDRIVKARGFNQNQKKMLITLVNSVSEMRQFGFLGDPTVNVLQLNLKLDKIN